MDSIEQALDLAKSAVKFDKENCADAAAYFYKEAAKLIEETAKALDPSVGEKWIAKAQEYQGRAEALLQPKLIQAPVAPAGSRKMKECKFLFNQAITADETDQHDLALELYTRAVELGLEAKQEIQQKDLQDKVIKICQKALKRAEELKGIRTQSVPQPRSTSSTIPVQTSSQPSDRQKQLKVTGNANYTEAEKKVLIATSRINLHQFVPFMDIDLKERFQFSIPFTDPDGFLRLSPKQKDKFAKWARPDEISSEPKLIVGDNIDFYSIRQTIVSDCSFVASLAVSALYEKKFGKSLITSIIYPRNSRGPIYNPYGKYMVKLHINGVPRKVIVDDYLPLGKHNELLCSFSTNKHEFWVSILEKAYMKVMGGYDFPGSNGNIDLHALTGWIPERVSIRLNEPDFNSEKLFDTLLLRLHEGKVLGSVATGMMPEADAERAGLITSHAYALLDVRKIQTENGETLKLMKLKNPWSHVRWKGKFSELDVRSWTKELCRRLEYDPASAASFDNGIFWIDYKSVLHFFDVFYLNWNPSLFNYTFCIHEKWLAGTGPAKDAYNISENPQYTLTIKPEGTGEVWILLTRHITELSDFKDNREYITVVVYKNQGKRVFYPHDPPPYLNGVRINSPHYMTKIVLQDTQERQFTLVVSQYEKMNTIYYTLRAYATCPFSLKKIINPYFITKELKGEWKGTLAGGCRNHPTTYFNNPTYEISLETPGDVLVELKAPKAFNIGLEVLNPETKREVTSSGNYRNGFVVLQLDNLPKGTYLVIPSTFYPNQESPYFLNFKSSAMIQIKQLQ